MGAPHLDEAAWAAVLADHLPEGRAWPREDGSALSRLLSGLAPGPARVEARALQLLDVEADPRTTQEMFSDWEAAFGLPDPCIPANSALNIRRASLVQRVTDGGGLSRERLIQVAAQLGFTVTINEFRPYQVGDPIGTPIYDARWRYVWQVASPSLTVRLWTIGTSAVGDPLRSWDNTILECVLNRLTTAHTRLLFKYGS